MLVKLSGIPWFLVGDFSIHVCVFRLSEWPAFLNAKLIHPDVLPTTTISKDRTIDFALIRKRIKHLFKECRPICSVPWGPHFGFIFDLKL